MTAIEYYHLVDLLEDEISEDGKRKREAFDEKYKGLFDPLNPPEPRYPLPARRADRDRLVRRMES